MSPDNRKHRGPGPQDRELFAKEQIALLAAAAKDYCWLLDKNYTSKASLKLVGDHFKLRERQRKALDRCCQPQLLINEIQKGKIKHLKAMEHQAVIIDGFNLLIITEAALGGAPVFRGRDGLIRDISGLHGSYRKISETPQAVSLVIDVLKRLNTGNILWIFDKPVSNSGRLATLVNEMGKEQNMNWTTELCDHADTRLAESGNIVISADSQVLTRSTRWFNLGGYLMDYVIKKKWLIDLWT